MLISKVIGLSYLKCSNMDLGRFLKHCGFL